MESTVKERLIKFIDYKGINKHSFEKTCGFSTGFVSNMRVSLQPNKVASIASNFPDLNTGWLLTGEGEMLKLNTNTSSINVDGDLNTIDMENKLRKTEALLDAMIEQNERLKAELAEYKAREIHSKGIA
ncbi:hypothetical protein [Bacteroides neonati]|uniref:hypothetical protein n=1 Tax=Bacteroides neonati TaxID=1347393 RepID=UPI0006944577|nr:hypothetical protein [Bacteroides neonati]